jgi:hypothetical protein
VSVGNTLCAVTVEVTTEVGESSIVAPWLRQRYARREHHRWRLRLRSSEPAGRA